MPARARVVRLNACSVLGFVIAVAWQAAAAQAEEPAEQVYIVQLLAPPAIAAPPAARGVPRNGRFNPRSEAVRSYTADLVEGHDALLESIGATDAKLYSYRYSFNGFAARLTAAQAAQLAADPAVARVWLDSPRTLRTNASPGFLGLRDKVEGLRDGLGLKGEDIVIGVIDSGITPGHPSFADTQRGRQPRVCETEWAENSLLGRWLCRRFRKRINLVYDPPRDWFGRCDAGERFSASSCNNKLIGARFYVDGFRVSFPMDANEFMSPLDADGHGTHIASVVAGNTVKATIGGTEAAAISGIAPRARIAMYKACWLQPGATRATCAMSDLQRAIEDAIADGVHIINYSIGTSEGSPADPDAQALLAASDAGVLAVVATGNGGPLPRTVESPASAPWVLSVAAASRAGTRYDDALRISAPAEAAKDLASREAAFTPILSSVGPIEGELLLADDGDRDEAGQDACEPLANAADIEGRIALIRRGNCEFQDKIANAVEAGALAVVVYNDSGEPFTMSGERGSVDIPAVMIGEADGDALVARLEDGEAVEVRLEKGLIVSRRDAGNVLAKESGRGPNALLPDILKPDLVAPGIDILGAQTADVANGVRGERYQYLSGTSMAVPHVAGVAALLMEAHPEWSPAAIRSALVTTARQNLRREDGTTPVDPFDAGGGYIVPNEAVEPGLVYDAGTEDYDAFACGAGIARVTEDACAGLEAAGYPLDAANLNLPSASVSDLVTTRILSRVVRNVGPPAQYRAVIAAPPGVSITVEPAVLSLDTGDAAEFILTASNLGAADRLGQWGFGALTWEGAGKEVRIPLAFRPEALAAPLVLSGTGVGGELAIPLEFGYTGPFFARVEGLAVPQIVTGEVSDDPLDFYTFLESDAALPDHVRRYRITVPGGTRYLRVAAATLDEGADDDIDLYVFCPERSCADGNEGYASTTTGAVEFVDIYEPLPGEYVIDVHGFETDDVVGGPGARFEMGTWLIAAAGGAGAPTVAVPAGATAGGSAEARLAWAGLEPGLSHLGLVVFSDGERDLGDTLVEIFSE